MNKKIKICLILSVVFGLAGCGVYDKTVDVPFVFILPEDYIVVSTDLERVYKVVPRKHYITTNPNEISISRVGVLVVKIEERFSK